MLKLYWKMWWGTLSFFYPSLFNTNRQSKCIFFSRIKPDLVISHNLYGLTAFTDVPFNRKSMRQGVIAVSRI